MANLRSYSFDKVTVALNGGRITGFWEGDDAVMVEQGADVTNNMVGADGSVLTSLTTDKSAVYTLKLQSAGEGHKLLTRMHQSYRNGAPYKFSVSIVDTMAGEGDASAECVLMQAPSSSKGQQASVREWKIFAPCNVPLDIGYNGL